ncbi:hypothetical protein [Methanothrix harundinacea]|uniref:Uncharacterized protein n=1 Tax=Methanothrix harundinacea (strain 6Ac) TaxID=1110509 RepID=G7WNJ8_METH6|nr:hypothetical protein [Methanothrix harundinacea]AET63974.1 hypothetical protein Mhar_0596 [Methanothrix harundinacea 6Ac]
MGLISVDPIFLQIDQKTLTATCAAAKRRNILIGSERAPLHGYQARTAEELAALLPAVLERAFRGEL